MKMWVTLSNNIEKKFGLSAIKDSFMFIAPEVKGDLALEQAEFQSIVSGEDVSIAVKNKTAVSIEWKVPRSIRWQRSSKLERQLGVSTPSYPSMEFLVNRYRTLTPNSMRSSMWNLPIILFEVCARVP